MAKTKETLDLEDALNIVSKKKREYGCEEVTIGFHKDGLGDEIVDYMTMDADEVFKCYELKVTLSDLKTDNKKSFYGDYNYLVVSKSLYAKHPTWENYIPPYCGILVGTELKVLKQAKKKTITNETRNMLKDSLLRSVFWKYENYKDAKDLNKYRDLQKQLQEAQQEIIDQQRENERLIWTYHDYEHWYQINHQDASFSIENAAKKERLEYKQRQTNGYTWIKMDNQYYCPNCNHLALNHSCTDYCPYCGTDLRLIKQ